jgi:formiminotetrahydrofolate cyclodeaminase
MPPQKTETMVKQAPELVIPQVINKSINLENLKQKDFQDEFMEKYNEFSDSWRELIEKERRF